MFVVGGQRAFASSFLSTAKHESSSGIKSAETVSRFIREEVANRII